VEHFLYSFVLFICVFQVQQWQFCSSATVEAVFTLLSALQQYSMLVELICMIICSIHLFIYFQNSGCNSTNSKI